MLGSLVLQGAMKPFFARPRPELAWSQVLPDYSFPSGHTLNAVVFYGGVALVIWSRVRASGRPRRRSRPPPSSRSPSASAASTSAYHFLTDVAGAMLAGIAWLLVVGAAFRARPTWRRWRSRERKVRRPAGPGTMAAR